MSGCASWVQTGFRVALSSAEESCTPVPLLQNPILAGRDAGANDKQLQNVRDGGAAQRRPAIATNTCRCS
jgi:hypothetical protein